MHALDAAGVLKLWERAEPLDGLDRAIEMAAAGGGAGSDALDELPLGRRNRRILRLRAAMRGRVLEATLRCRNCGETIEFSLDSDELTRDAAVEPAEVTVEIRDVSMVCRPPTSADLRRAAQAASVAEAEAVLMARCIRATDAGGEGVAAADLPAEARRAAAEAIAEADPLAEVLVDAECSECGAPFVAEVDIARFAWSDVEHRAREVLRDIDALARAYGWSEPQVLALSEHRRKTYLELVGVDTS